MQIREPEKCKVAAVMGNEVRIYGPLDNGFRPYIRTIVCNNRGQALQVADEFDALQQQRD